MGIDDFTVPLWDKQHIGIVERMRTYYARWARAHLHDGRAAYLFAAWLRRPGPAPLRMEGVIWVRDAAREADEHWWRERDLADALAELLDVCWRHHRNELARQPEADGAFKELTKMLADRQHPLAMDLQQRIATGT
jgi:hypothetical protein